MAELLEVYDGLGKSRLQLPASCEPPCSFTPAKQLVWIVSCQKLSYYSATRLEIPRYLAEQVTWAARL